MKPVSLRLPWTWGGRSGRSRHSTLSAQICFIFFFFFLFEPTMPFWSDKLMSVATAESLVFIFFLDLLAANISPNWSKKYHKMPNFTENESLCPEPRNWPVTNLCKHTVKVTTLRTFLAFTFHHNTTTQKATHSGHGNLRVLGGGLRQQFANFTTSSITSVCSVITVTKHNRTIEITTGTWNNLKLWSPWAWMKPVWNYTGTVSLKYRPFPFNHINAHEHKRPSERNYFSTTWCAPPQHSHNSTTRNIKLFVVLNPPFLWRGQNGYKRENKSLWTKFTVSEIMTGFQKAERMNRDYNMKTINLYKIFA